MHFLCFVLGWLVCLPYVFAGKRFRLESMAADLTPMRQQLLKRGWTEAGKAFSSDFLWTWADEVPPRGYWNHFPHFEELGTKDHLLKNLVRQHGAKYLEFAPRSYNYSDPAQKACFLDDFNNVASCDSGCRWPAQDFIASERNLWIAKPAGQARGVGIYLFDSLDQLKLPETGSLIVQKYVENPLLIKGRKFDIRQFVLVASLNPLVLYLNRDYYLRFSSVPYDAGNLMDRFVHLTNHQVQKDFPGHAAEDAEFPDNQWNHSRFEAWLAGAGGHVAALRQAIGRIATATVQAWPPHLHRPGSFELLGFDILLTDRFRPILLERKFPDPQADWHCLPT